MLLRYMYLCIIEWSRVLDTYISRQVPVTCCKSSVIVWKNWVDLSPSHTQSLPHLPNLRLTTRFLLLYLFLAPMMLWHATEWYTMGIAPLLAFLVIGKWRSTYKGYSYTAYFHVTAPRVDCDFCWSLAHPVNIRCRSWQKKHTHNEMESCDFVRGVPWLILDTDL